MASKPLTDVPETNHEAMQAFATHRVAGLDGASPHEPIPGEYDRDTLTHRQPGAIGGQFNGSDASSANMEESMDDATRHDREMEGGDR